MQDGVSRARLEPGSTERFVRLRKELDVSSFGINQLNLEPGQRGRIHRHERQEEVYLVLSGELTVLIEGDEQTLGEGELMRVAPAVRRQLANTSGARVELLALGGSGTHEGRDGEAFSDWGQEVGAPPQEVPMPADLPAG